MNRCTRVCLAAVATLAVMAAVPDCACAFNVFKVDKDCVGSGAYATIQEAINVASLSFGEDYIWIANNHAYPETISIIDQDLIIEGGFTDCNDNDIGPSDRSYISGLDGTTSVITISENSHVILSNLGISGGTYGSGVHFDGQGELTISNSEIEGNHASRGGGIYFNGQGGPATLTLQDGVLLYGNDAPDSGGGIYVSGQARLLMLSPNSLVDHNKAANYGGGIAIVGPARADIGAPGSFAVVTSNNADFGGGIAVTNGGVVRIFPHDASQPSGIGGNTATLYGGGIYAEGDVCLFNPSLQGNSAVQGGAVFHKGSGGIYINSGFPARLGDECGPETVAALGGEANACDNANCSLVASNMAQEGFAGLYGAVIFEQGGDLIASRLRLQFNYAGYAIQTFGKTTDISTSLITNNSVADVLVSIDGTFSGSASFTGSTFADDTIGGGYVFRFLNGAAGTMTRDIIAEAPKLSASASGPLTVNYTMSNEIGTLPHNGNATVVAADPQFVDEASADYHLRSSSPALDFAPAVAGDIDIEQASRSVDLPGLSNIFGPTDLGAYERQYLCAADQIFCNGFDR